MSVEPVCNKAEEVARRAYDNAGESHHFRLRCAIGAYLDALANDPPLEIVDYFGRADAILILRTLARDLGDGT